MEDFIRGAVAMGMAVAGLFFLRYWRDTRDRLFAFFGLAFFVLSINRGLITLVGHGDERVTYLYVIRLLAFLIILYAIGDRNLRPEQRP